MKKILLSLSIIAVSLAANAQEKFDTTTADFATSFTRVLVVPEYEATLSSQIAGRISKKYPKVGESFKEGEALVEFDCSIYDAERRKAEAEYDAARKTLVAQQRLSKLNSVSDLELDLSKSAAKRTKAELDVSKWNQNECTIKAPYDGKVVYWHVKSYENIKTSEPLVDIVSSKNLHLQMFVPSEQLKTLKSGTTFNFSLDETGKKYQGKISSIGAKVDAASQTIEVRADILSKASEIIAGMSGGADFE